METPRRDLKHPRGGYSLLPVASYSNHDSSQKCRSHSFRPRALRWLVVIAVLSSALIISIHLRLVPTRACIKVASSSALDTKEMGHEGQDLCVQETLLEPQHALYERLGYIFGTSDFRDHAISLHSGAVQIPTESDNQMGDVGEDMRWEAFEPFHDYLHKSFPRVHDSLRLTKINTYGLVYMWEGSDLSRQPLLLMGHQDVVPVDPDTVHKWTHPPYSGFYDGERIWGRGSQDDKSGLMGILIAIETLLEQGFAPKRGIVLSFGFDEESGGLKGAKENANALMTIFGEKSFAMIVDEGGGFTEQYGGVFAMPNTAEKGYLDIRVVVNTPGGHSSIPPSHTSIGMLSRMLVEYETHPHTAHLHRDTPMFNSTQCLATHAPHMPQTLRDAIQRASKSDHALQRVEEIWFQDAANKALASTTQAVDLIRGGVKANALPESAYAIVNHRIDASSSVQATMDYNTQLLRPFAERYNLSFTAFGSAITNNTEPAYGTLELSDAWGTALEPAPITPMDAKPYKLLSGTIKAVYAAHRNAQGIKNQDIVVAPGMMLGNTDTRFYWGLSDHIFRYNHRDQSKRQGVHTINENVLVDELLEQVRFFSTLILNVDEGDL